MKKNVKKWIVSALVCAMIFSLAGCGSSSGKEADQTGKGTASSDKNAAVDSDANSNNEEGEQASADSDFPNQSVMTVRLKTEEKYYSDNEHTELTCDRTNDFDLLGIRIHSISEYPKDNDSSEFQSSNVGTWVTDSEYVYLDEDGERAHVTDSQDFSHLSNEYYFDEDGHMTSIVLDGGGIYTYADEDECPGAVFKTIGGICISYFDESGLPLGTVRYTGDPTDENSEIDDSWYDYCVSGKSLEVRVKTTGSSLKIVTKYSCNPEYDADGKLIREEHRFLSCTWSDGSPYKDNDRVENELEETIEYSYDENGVLREKRQLSYNYDGGDGAGTDKQFNIGGTVYSYDESGRFTGSVDFHAYSKPGVYDELDEDTITYSSSDEEYLYTDVEVLADPLLIFYLEQLNSNEILPGEELAALIN